MMKTSVETKVRMLSCAVKSVRNASFHLCLRCIENLLLRPLMKEKFGVRFGEIFNLGDNEMRNM